MEESFTMTNLHFGLGSQCAPANRIHAGVLLSLILWITLSSSATAADVPRPVAEIVSIEGTVEVREPGGSQWFPIDKEKLPRLYAGYLLRTHRNGRLSLKLTDGSIQRLPGDSVMQLVEQREESPGIVRLLKGALFFFHRDKRDTRIETRFASAAIKGTEFVVTVDDETGMVLTLIEGQVDVENELGSESLVSGERAVVAPQKAPRKTSVLDTRAVLDWALYYPAVINLNELELESETEDLADSIAAYRSGNLPSAITAYPWDADATGSAQLVFEAGLELAAGNPGDAEATLRKVMESTLTKENERRIARSLLRLIDVVAFRPTESNIDPVLTTELIVESISEQAQGNLSRSLEHARDAAKLDPTFGYAHARVAGLEFGFGRTEAALAAIEESMRWAPENAETWVVRGFLESARGNLDVSRAHFIRAAELDGHLANARLGLGLLSIREGDLSHGIEQLQLAAALEPNRSLLRSYLGKAYSEAYRADFAARELDLAVFFDPNDPTARLYSALFLQRENRPNEAIRDLEESMRLNDNRRLFRSGLLLDQDEAVKGANLAGLYGEVGMSQRALSEASRAVETDYGNYSAHLFLANAYNSLRDSGDVDLRYETAAVGEHLTANLLAPVDSGVLAGSVSAGEYSPLFESERRFGVISATEYSDNGDWSHTSSVHGRNKDTAISLDLIYWDLNGYFPNQDNEVFSVGTRLKQQVTSKDAFYLDVNYNKRHRGDVGRKYDDSDSWIDPTLDVEEEQAPNVLLGYHREWQPGSHTLAIAGLIDSEQILRTANTTFLQAPTWLQEGFSFDSNIELQGFLSEVQHTITTGRNSFVVGVRFAVGDQKASTNLGYPPLGDDTPREAQAEERWARFGIYAYDTVRLLDGLYLTPGVAYDQVTYPTRLQSMVAASGTRSVSRVSPKLGLRWDATDRTSIHAGYAMGLSGVGLEQSYRLEPTQIGGVNQAERGTAPGELSAARSGLKMDVAGLGVDHAFGHGLYAGARVNTRSTEGAFERAYHYQAPKYLTAKESYRENSIEAYASWLAAKRLSIGLSYSATAARLTQNSSIATDLDADYEGLLHRLTLQARYQHESGFFVAAEGSLYHQTDLEKNQSELPDETFATVNLHVGRYFAKRRARVSLGVLNLFDQDYRLHPINFYREPARERTIVLNLRLNY